MGAVCSYDSNKPAEEDVVVEVDENVQQITLNPFT